MAEPFIGRAPVGVEESVAEFVLRRLGLEFLDYAIDPLVGGVYAGDPSRLSVRQAFPKLDAVEQRYRSLILGQFLGARERKRQAEVSKQNAPKVSFDEGLQVLTDELGRQLGDSVLLDSPVNSIEETDTGWLVTATRQGRVTTRPHSRVVFTGTAHRLAQLKIVAKSPPTLLSLSRVYYPPVVSLVLGFRREDVAHSLDGFGVLVPQIEGFNILGAVFSSSLFPNRAPEGHVTVTCYLGGARNPELAGLLPESLTDMAVKDLGRLLGVRGRPTFQQYFAHANAIPQYEVGYGAFKQLMRDAEARCPGFFIAGHYRDGISLADCVVSGCDAAGRVSEDLNRSKAGADTSRIKVKAAATA
jgi:oxygen-dependent protoporphyrinogen oxidase